MRGEIDAGIATADRDGCRQIAARAVAGDAEARIVSTELADPPKDIARRCETILERAGKTRFRRAPVVDRDDDRAGLDRQQPGLPVMGFEIAGDPAAAVEETTVGDVSCETR